MNHALVRQEEKSYFKQAVTIVVIIFLTCWISDLTSIHLAFFLFWLPLLVKFVLMVPTGQGAFNLFVIGMVLEPPDERAGNGYWDPPFTNASTAFFQSIKAWLGVPGLSLNVCTLLCLAFLFKAYKESKSGISPPPSEAITLVKLYFAGLFGLFAWGMLRGGALQPAFWQVVQPFLLGIAALAFTYSIRDIRDIRALGVGLIVVAITKGLLVMWVYQVVCRPLNIKPFYATTHSDSITFATVFVIACVRLLSERSKPALKMALLLVPFILVAVVMNNRRLAFVGMGLSLIAAYVMLEKGKLKRRITTAAICLSPFFLAYVQIGKNSSNPFFAPAKAIGSVTTSSDASSITREIENYNLIQTSKRSMILGTGFGHEYIEFVRADDISQGHPLYLYIPHNSVLWLMGVGGLIGFGLLWLPYPGLAYFSARAYRRAKDPLSKTITLTCTGSTFVLMAQAWGDMGTNSFTCAILHAACFGAAARMSQLELEPKLGVYKEAVNQEQEPAYTGPRPATHPA